MNITQKGREVTITFTLATTPTVSKSSGKANILATSKGFVALPDGNGRVSVNCIA